VQPLAQSLTLFQRTPPWVMPRHDRAVPSWRRALYRRVPAAQRAERAMLYGLRELMFVPFRHRLAARVAQRMALKHLATQVRDPSLRAALTPSYTIGCKRVLLSDDYYPALTQPNVSVTTSPIDRVCAEGVVTADGAVHEADVIIYGTGFHVTDSPIATRVRGRGGMLLADAWRGSPAAYMGTTTTGFPNLFFLLGPNTGLGHSSVVLMVEAQIEHVLGVLALMNERNAGAVEPTDAAQHAFVRWVDDRLAPTVWNSGGCRSWYLDVNGRNSALWPERVGRFRRVVSSVQAADYAFTPRVVLS
jgi:cation diffusion facilitator CzcD-associated flavoprotein CzcO